ncbi:MAG: transcriptional regulator [Candidatus Helarchaeota archaeon]|nr:transcriptional regulator [Candidatus Helarchaeota archaeon]
MVEKDLLGKKPHNMLRLTAEGRAAFQAYRESMKQFFNGLPE